MAVLKSASEVAGMIEPLDNTAENSVADVVCVSLWSLSLKFIVPDNWCSPVEPVVSANSLKLSFTDEEVKVGT